MMLQWDAVLLITPTIVPAARHGYIRVRYICIRLRGKEETVREREAGETAASEQRRNRFFVNVNDWRTASLIDKRLTQNWDCRLCRHMRPDNLPQLRWCAVLQSWLNPLETLWTSRYRTLIASQVLFRYDDLRNSWSASDSVCFTSVYVETRPRDVISTFYFRCAWRLCVIQSVTVLAGI